MSECPFDIQPFAQSEPIRTPQLPSLNYLNLDYFSLKSRLRDLIKEKAPKDFNDFIESSLLIMLMEIWAFIGDTITFKIDQTANEIYIDTVTELENAFRLSKLVGFQPTPPIAARAFFSATINNVLATDLIIPAGLSLDVVSNNQSTAFELFPADANNNPVFDEDILIPAGTFTNTAIIGIEGRTTRDLFEGNGQINQSYAIPTVPVIYDSIRVIIDGIRWNRVEYFTDDMPRREYRVEFDSNYQAFIIFGNNKAGLIPTTGSQIEVIYRVGGGTVGNIITGFIDVQRNVEATGFDFSIPVSFRNYTKGEFGYEGDDIEDIRRKLPSYLKAQNRCVTGTDYKTIADQFVTAYHGQIGKSTAVLRNYGCAANVIDLYVLARDGELNLTTANDDLKTSLSEEINTKKMITDYVCIRNGNILLVDIVIDLTIDKFYKKMKEEFNLKIKNKTNNFFSLYNWEYGQTLRDVDLIKHLSEIREVKRFDISFVTNDPDNSGAIVTSKFNEIIRPDTITISFLFE
jgi:hypothetical protein